MISDTSENVHIWPDIGLVRGGGENSTILKHIFRFIDEMIIIIQTGGLLLEHIQKSQLVEGDQSSIFNRLPFL